MKRLERHLPRLVEAWKLAQHGAGLEGYLKLSDLPRLVALLAKPNPEAVVPVKMVFGIDGEGHRLATGSVVTALPLICQRCLELMEYEVNAGFQWALVTSDEEARALPPELDPVMLVQDSKQLDLYTMLEDELLLSLPITALHDQCEGAGVSRHFGETDEELSASTHKPFATLADLLKKES